MVESKNDYLIDYYRIQNRNQYLGEEKKTLEEIESMNKMVSKLDLLSRLYFKDEHKKQLRQYDRPIFGNEPTLDRRLVAMNCAYESTVEFNRKNYHPIIKTLMYIFKKPLR